MSTLLPELPEPDGYAALTPRGTIIVPPQEFAKHNAYAIFTADQVRAIQLEAWKAGVEAAAMEAEGFRSNDRAVNLTAREIIAGEVAEDIAAAIRSLPSPE